MPNANLAFPQHARQILSLSVLFILKNPSADLCLVTLNFSSLAAKSFGNKQANPFQRAASKFFGQPRLTSNSLDDELLKLKDPFKPAKIVRSMSLTSSTSIKIVYRMNGYNFNSTILYRSWRGQAHAANNLCWLEGIFQFWAVNHRANCCEDELTGEIFEAALENGVRRLVAKGFGAKLESFKVTRHQVRKDSEMNKRLEKEFGERVVEKRVGIGIDWLCLWYFGVEVKRTNYSNDA